MKNAGLIVLIIGVIFAAGASVQFGETDYQIAVGAGTDAAGIDSAVEVATPSPRQRLGEWMDDHMVGFAFGIVLVIVGSLMFRRGDQQGRESTVKGTTAAGNWQVAMQSLSSEVDEVRQLLDQEGPDLNQARDKIEALIRDTIEPLVESRMELQQQFGLAAFTKVMGPLSGAERFVNRSWTVLVDGHLDEARISMAAAQNSVSQASDELGQLIGIDKKSSV